MIAAADRAPDAYPEGYAGDQLTENIGPTVSGTTSYSGTLTSVPVRPFKTEIRVTIAGAPPTQILIRDVDGNGQLVGYQSYGTINYLTGAVNITIPNPGASNAPIYVTYATDFEAQTEIPKIIMRLETKSVNARVFALKDTVGLEQSYALRRRFGLIAEDEIATDLVSSINSEITRTLIRLLDVNTMGTTIWPKAPPSGVSSFEHYQTYKLALADAEAVLLGNAGRGTISSMIVGRNMAAVIQTLPGFVKLSDGSTIGSHIFGTLDGMTVIRVPYAYDLDPDRGICLYKGLSPFEAPAVYAPYMPLVVTTALPTGLNPLMNQKAAAVWAACDELVPAFSTRIQMDTTPTP